MNQENQSAATENSLTTDPGSLMGLCLVFLALNGYLLAENRRLQERVVELEAALKLERAKRFGRSSERSQDKEQSSSGAPLIIEGEWQDKTMPPPSSSSPADPPQKKKKERGGQPGHLGHGRNMAPDLPRQEVWLYLPEEEQVCPDCGKPRHPIAMTEDSEEIVVAVKSHVRRYRRQYYQSGCDCPHPRLLAAPPAAKIIPKGKFGVESWVKFLLDKYQFQTPIARQIKQLAQIGVPVSSGTIHGGFEKLAGYLLPLYEAFVVQIQTAVHLHADETRWRVFEEVEGKSGSRWWMWLFASSSAGVVVFALDMSRSAKVPKKLLSRQLLPDETPPAGSEVFEIEGERYVLNDQLAVISADRLRVYQAISKLLEVAFCWSHVRRDFTDFGKANASNPVLAAWAESWVEEIGYLFHLNQQRLAVLSQPDLFQPAQARLEATVDAFHNRIFARAGLLPAQEKILVSLERHWSGLTLFVADPTIPMDNNWAERLLRPAVLGRKNYYGHFAQWSGELGAMVFSIIETCKLNGLNPYQFLLDYFTACAELGHAPNDLTPFLPWLYKDRPPP